VTGHRFTKPSYGRRVNDTANVHPRRWTAVFPSRPGKVAASTEPSSGGRSVSRAEASLPPGDPLSTRTRPGEGPWPSPES
jgi:hypothetical protein